MDVLSQLLSKIRDELPNIEDTDEYNVINTHYNNTIKYIKSRIEIDAKENKVSSYDGIVLWFLSLSSLVIFSLWLSREFIFNSQDLKFFFKFTVEPWLRI